MGVRDSDRMPVGIELEKRDLCGAIRRQCGTE